MSFWTEVFAERNHLGCLCVRSIFFSAIKGCLLCLFALFMWWPTMRLVALYLQGRAVGLVKMWGVSLLNMGGVLLLMPTNPPPQEFKYVLLYYAHSLKFGLLPELSNLI